MNFNRCHQWIQSHTDVLIDLIRIYLGIGLFVKGVVFMQNRESLINLLDSAGSQMIWPAGIAHYVLAAHFAGGILLAIGLVTRIAAAVQIPILFGAVFLVSFKNVGTLVLEEGERFQFSMLVLFLLVILFAHGPGRLSVDHVLSKKLDASSPPSAKPEEAKA